MIFALMGWAWGAGFEYILAPKWSIKAEYLGLGFNHGVGFCAGVAPGAPRAGVLFAATPRPRPFTQPKSGSTICST